MTHAYHVFIESFRLLYRNIFPLIWMNVLWLVLSLPIVSWPPATAALYHVVHQVVAGKDITTRLFFEGFRRHFYLSWGLVGLNLALLVFAGYAVIFYLNQSDWLRFVAVPFIYLLLFWLMMQMYLFPLLIAQQEKRMTWIFRNAILLILRHPQFSITLSLLTGLWILVCLALNGPLLLVMASGTAVIQTHALATLLREHGRNQ